MKVVIDDTLVRRLVAGQFPRWAELPMWSIAQSGWDNRTFHLGEHMIVRLPSGSEYAAQVEKEHWWLPRLAPLLPLPIPTPLAIGVRNLGALFMMWFWITGALCSHQDRSRINFERIDDRSRQGHALNPSHLPSSEE